MTTPIYFPFTHIANRAAGILSVFFQDILYMDVTGDPLKMNVPLKTIPIKLPDLMVQNAQMTFIQYQEWAKIHKGNEHNLKLLLADNPYFREDTQVTAIKSQLKGGDKKSDKPSKDGSVEKDLLFLMAAHACDTQNEAIDHELASLDQAKQKLIDALRGEPEFEKKEPLSDSAFISDPGAMMPQKRIKAWEKALSVSTAFNPCDPVLLVTTSEAVFESFQSNNPSCLNALDIDGIKVHDMECENKTLWQQAFIKQLSRVAQGKDFQEDTLPGIHSKRPLTGRVKVDIFPGNEINTSFDFSDNQVAVCLVKLKS